MIALIRFERLKMNKQQKLKANLQIVLSFQDLADKYNKWLWISHLIQEEALAHQIDTKRKGHRFTN